MNKKTPSLKKKVFVLGIDGLVPRLVFDQYRAHLPTFSRLMKEGAYARLQSTVPPSSIVAWTSIASGKDPAQTGIHSYTNPPHKSRGTRLTTSQDVRVPLLWDILTTHHKKSIALNIPLTYPVRPINGFMVSDFLTPSFDTHSVYPLSYKKKITQLLKGKEYMFDVAGFTGYKKMDLQAIVDKTYEMTDMHFTVANDLFRTADWDLFFMVAIGSDRLHHMFWRHIDPAHSQFVKNSKYKNVVLDFYTYLDAKLASFLKVLDTNPHATVLIVSDHGMDKMEQRFNLNDWLIKKGHLTLTAEAKLLTTAGPKRLEYGPMIDWKKTVAVASGGYQGRIYLLEKNKEKRAKLKRSIMQQLAKIPGARGEQLENHVFDTATLYARVDSAAPDIIVYFDNLRYGVNNDVGNVGLYSTATTVGVDDAGHAPLGSIIIRSSDLLQTGDLGTLDILQVAPTILKALDLPEYKKLRGAPLL